MRFVGRVNACEIGCTDGWVFRLSSTRLLISSYVCSHFCYNSPTPTPHHRRGSDLRLPKSSAKSTPHCKGIIRVLHFEHAADCTSLLTVMRDSRLFLCIHANRCLFYSNSRSPFYFLRFSLILIILIVGINSLNSEIRVYSYYIFSFTVIQ
jgi:hypothetical protein